MTDQLWVSAEVKRSPGSVVLVSPTVLPATSRGNVWLTSDSSKNNEIHNSYNDIHNFIMRFIYDVYK